MSFSITSSSASDRNIVFETGAKTDRHSVTGHIPGCQVSIVVRIGVLLDVSRSGSIIWITPHPPF